TPRTTAVVLRVDDHAQTNGEEEIETVRDYYSLPLPTSPAPSPPRPEELCPRRKCSLTGNPNETMRFTYRKNRDDNNKTIRDALGKQTFGRHQIPAREFTIDRVYMTPSSISKEAHGIAYWPYPP
ncbi:hypothetical protein PMAYCL1PPCAC_06465, partial [Pristionchus mayeri]